MKFETLRKSKALNSMVTTFICNFWWLSILIPANVGTCQFLGQSYGRRTTSSSILMKFCTLNKSRVANSMMAIVFCDSWRLSNLTVLNIGICHLLGHIFNKSCKNFNLVKFYTLHKSKTLSSMVTVVLCDSWCLSIWSLSILARVMFWATNLDEERQMLKFWWNFVFCTNRRC